MPKLTVALPKADIADPHVHRPLLRASLPSLNRLRIFKFVSTHGRSVQIA
jgi:hypothetical protein